MSRCKPTCTACLIFSSTGPYSPFSSKSALSRIARSRPLCLVNVSKSFISHSKCSSRKSVAAFKLLPVAAFKISGVGNTLLSLTYLVRNSAGSCSLRSNSLLSKMLWQRTNVPASANIISKYTR